MQKYPPVNRAAACEPAQLVLVHGERMLGPRRGGAFGGWRRPPEVPLARQPGIKQMPEPGVWGAGLDVSNDVSAVYRMNI